MRPTEAIIDLGAIGRNVERLVAHSAPAQICAVTKADGYGHGAVAVSRVAIEAGASMVAVALVEEGIELRNNGITSPILLLSEPRPNEMFEVVSARLTPTVYTPQGIAALVAAFGFEPGDEPLDIQLNIDTGMNRVGLRPRISFKDAADAAEVAEIVRAIAAKPGLRLSGVWTHLAVADEPERPETAEQLARFERALEVIASELPGDVVVHAANSAGLFAHAGSQFDVIRSGIAIYGIAPASALGADLGLEPAMALHTELGFVKPVRAGEAVSYGLAHTFDEDTMLGTIPIGYADGLRRDAGHRGQRVLVGGRRRPIVGTVTMDQAMVDLGPDASDVSGNPVVVIGSQGDEQITATEVADALDTIPYEIVCAIGGRVRRRYL